MVKCASLSKHIALYIMGISYYGKIFKKACQQHSPLIIIMSGKVFPIPPPFTSLNQKTVISCFPVCGACALNMTSYVVI